MNRPLIYLVAPPFCGHLHPILGMAAALAGEYEVVVGSTERSQAALAASPTRILNTALAVESS